MGKTMKTIKLLMAVFAMLMSSQVWAGGQGTVMDEAWDAMKDTSDVNVSDKWNY